MLQGHKSKMNRNMVFVSKSSSPGFSLIMLTSLVLEHCLAQPAVSQLLQISGKSW